MAFERRQYSGNAVPTTVPGGLGTGETSIAIAASTGWPDASVGPFFATIDQGTATEERIKCTARSGGTLTATRGADGTSAASHVVNAPITHSHSKTDLDEANQHYADTTLDHHSQYARTDGTRTITGVFKVTGLGSATHEANRVDSQGQVYGRGFAFAADTATHQGGVNGGLSISVNRATPAASLNNATGDILRGYAGSTLRFNLLSSGSIACFGGATLANAATGGYLGVPFVVGTPTGVPDVSAAVVYDTTNNKLYCYNGAWRSVSLS